MISTIVSVIELIVLIVGFMFIVKAINKKSNRILEFDEVIKNIDFIVSNYKTNILNVKIDNLSRVHDLDKSSESNSIKLFTTKVNKLIEDSTSDLVKKYFPDDLIINVSKYFTDDSFVLYIVSKLKE